MVQRVCVQWVKCKRKAVPLPSWHCASPNPMVVLKLFKGLQILHLLLMWLYNITTSSTAVLCQKTDILKSVVSGCWLFFTIPSISNNNAIVNNVNISLCILLAVNHFIQIQQIERWNKLNQLMNTKYLARMLMNTFCMFLGDIILKDVHKVHKSNNNRNICLWR